MRKIILFTLFSLISISIFSQSIVNCKSGQILNLTLEGALESSNLKELAEKESKKPEIQELMSYLLLKEQENRISAYLLNNKISLLELDIKIDKSDSKKTELKAKKSTLSMVEKEYKEISNSINGLRKRDKTIVANLTKEIKEPKESPTVITEEVAEKATDATVVVQNQVEEADAKVKESAVEINSPEIIEDKMKESGNTSEPAKKAKKSKKRNPKKDKDIKAKRSENDATHEKNNTDKSNSPQNKISIPRVVECNQFDIRGKDNYGTQTALLTQYTPAKLENYFKQESFLTISTGVQVANDVHILNVKCDFVPKDISKSYGAVAIGDFLRIQFINGKHIFLKAVNVKGPIVEQYSGHSIYEFDYKFESKDDFDKLKGSLLDSVGIMWSTGFEDYQIYNIDFFQNLFNDLETCKKSKLP